MVNVSHHRDDRRTRTQRLFIIIVAVVEEGVKLNLLLLTRVDEKEFGADIKREQFHMVIGQCLGCRHHLAVVEQELHNIGCRAIQLWSELLCGDTTLDHDDAVRDGCIAIGKGQMLWLQLVLVATTTTL